MQLSQDERPGFLQDTEKRRALFLSLILHLAFLLLFVLFYRAPEFVPQPGYFVIEVGPPGPGSGAAEAARDAETALQATAPAETAADAAPQEPAAPEPASPEPAAPQAAAPAEPSPAEPSPPEPAPAEPAQAEVAPPEPQPEAVQAEAAPPEVPQAEVAQPEVAQEGIQEVAQPEPSEPQPAPEPAVEAPSPPEPAPQLAPRPLEVEEPAVPAAAALLAPSPLEVELPQPELVVAAPLEVEVTPETAVEVLPAQPVELPVPQLELAQPVDVAPEVEVEADATVEAEAEIEAEPVALTLPQAVVEVTVPEPEPVAVTSPRPELEVRVPEPAPPQEAETPEPQTPATAALEPEVPEETASEPVVEPETVSEAMMEPEPEAAAEVAAPAAEADVQEPEPLVDVSEPAEEALETVVLGRREAVEPEPLEPEPSVPVVEAEAEVEVEVEVEVPQSPAALPEATAEPAPDPVLSEPAADAPPAAAPAAPVVETPLDVAPASAAVEEAAETPATAPTAADAETEAAEAALESAAVATPRTAPAAAAPREGPDETQAAEGASDRPSAEAEAGGMPGNRPLEPFEDRRNRPIVVILDNADTSAGRQSGLREASFIYEMPVEGNMTRLMAVFDQADPSRVGPIRSARDYQHRVVEDLGGALVHIGGSPSALDAIARGRAPSFDALERRFAQLYSRAPDASPPYNLFGNGSIIRVMLRGSGLDTVRHLRGTIFRPGPELPESSFVQVSYPGGYSSGFTYLREPNLYRWQRSGTPAVDANREGVVVQAVVVARIDGSPIPGDPEGRLFLAVDRGGEATLYLGGKVMQGRWRQEGGFQFVGADGQPVDLTPFKTWVAMVPTWAQVTGP